MATQRNNSAKGAPAPATKGDGATRQVLQVVSKRDGFRRAGRAWSGTTTVALGELTQEQYEQLSTEPMLVTLLLEVPPTRWTNWPRPTVHPPPKPGTDTTPAKGFDPRAALPTRAASPGGAPPPTSCRGWITGRV